MQPKKPGQEWRTIVRSSVLQGVILAIAVAVIASVAGAQEPSGTVERRIQELERKVADGVRRERAMQDRISELERSLLAERRQNESRIAAMEERVQSDLDDFERAIESIDALENSPAASSALAVGGYFDIEFRIDQAKDHPTFDQHRLILKFDGDVSDWIAFRTEIEIEGGGVGASFLSDSEIVVEYAELHFRIDRAFNVKAGALLVPFGRFNVLHDSPLRDLTDRPLVARRIIPTTWDDSGIGFYGSWEMFGVVFDYDVIVSNGLDDDFSTTPGGGFRGNRNSFRVDNNDNKMVIGRLGVTPDLGFFDALNLGVSFGTGEYDDGDDHRINMFAFDWTIKKGPFELIGEFAVYDLERGAAEVAAGVPGGASGYYVQLNFHFFPDTWRDVRPFFGDESTFTLVFRVGSQDTDDSATGIDRMARGAGVRDDILRYTVGLNFRPIEKTVFKIEYQWIVEPGFDDVDNDRFVVSFATYF